MPDLEPYLQCLEYRTWAVVLPYNKRRDMFAEKRVYASPRSERQVHGQLSLIYLRAMRSWAYETGFHLMWFQTLLRLPYRQTCTPSL